MADKQQEDLCGLFLGGGGGCIGGCRVGGFGGGGGRRWGLLFGGRGGGGGCVKTVR